MTWWRSWAANSDGSERWEAEKTLAAIFKPSHAAVDMKAVDASDLALGQRTSAGRVAGEVSFAVANKNSNVAGGCATAVVPLERCDGDTRTLAGCTEEVRGGHLSCSQFLPPSPIFGYTLREKGLVDELVDPPRTLSAEDVRSLITELSSVEQRAKYVVDAQLPRQVHNRGRRGLELFVNPCLHIYGLYLMLWKAPHLYFSATPRSSVFFTRIFALMRWRLLEAEKEQLARDHRWFFQATNARVTLSFLSGFALTAVAVATRPSLDVADVGPEVELGKQSVGFQQHSEASLRWLWLVYYHHPAYCFLAKGAIPPILQGIKNK